MADGRTGVWLVTNAAGIGPQLSPPEQQKRVPHWGVKTGDEKERELRPVQQGECGESRGKSSIVVLALVD